MATHPALYSPVRAVPLRPRLHSPNSHKAAAAPAAPKQSSGRQTTAPTNQAPPISRPAAGLNTCPLSQSVLGTSQSQQSSLPVSGPVPAAPHFERSQSAARQLQIIALSSGRQPPPATYAHAPPGVESPELSSQSQRTLSSEDVLPLSINSSLPKTASVPPVRCPPPPPPPPPPPSQAAAQTHTLVIQDGKHGKVKDNEEQRERGASGTRQRRDEGSVGQDLRVDRDEQRDKVKEEKTRPEGGEAVSQTGEEEQMDVTVEGQSAGERTEEKKTEEEEDGETAMDQSEDTCHNMDPKTAVTGQRSEPKPVLGLTAAPVQTSDTSVQSLTEPHQDVQPLNEEDFCENMSTQSDNQSALSSLSSQSPPSSPFIPAHPAHLSLSQHETDKVHQSVAQLQNLAEPEAEPEHFGQSEDESEGFIQPLSDPWVPKAWPEGHQVLTHLVEGFVIQEGLQPFPVNRSSLLLPEQVNKQEVNGTNGRAALPVTDTPEKPEHSTDSDEEGGDMDDPGTRSGHRDRVVLHCQFCGKRGHAHNFMRSKRFCSTSCARGFNVRLTKRLRALSASGRSERPRPALNRAESVPGKPLLLRLPRDLWSAGRRDKEGKEKTAAEEEEEEEEEGGEEEEDEDGGDEDPAAAMAARMESRAERRARRASAPAVTASTPTTTFKPGPSQWSVEEVTAFIHTLPGCGDVAEAFRLQEIDGQALLLLTEDHLMTSMNIKLGPALKICAHINALKNQ
ncbi:hypothetical protein LDENG_00097520 [Lucifuga dentata]|nr:hypothetical protein LDENG_00097520 [Lucifuga dentata]